MIYLIFLKSRIMLNYNLPMLNYNLPMLNYDLHAHFPAEEFLVDHMSGSGNLLPKFMPISFFRRASRL